MYCESLMSSPQYASFLRAWCGIFVQVDYICVLSRAWTLEIPGQLHVVDWREIGTPMLLLACSLAMLLHLLNLTKHASLLQECPHPYDWVNQRPQWRNAPLNEALFNLKQNSAYNLLSDTTLVHMFLHPFPCVLCWVHLYNLLVMDHLCQNVGVFVGEDDKYSVPKTNMTMVPIIVTGLSPLIHNTDSMLTFESDWKWDLSSRRFFFFFFYDGICNFVLTLVYQLMV